MTTTFCVLVEEIEAKKAILRVYLRYLDWGYLPRARPFFLMAIGGAVTFAGSELQAALGKGWLDEEFLQTRAPDFIHSVRELETKNFPMKKGFRPDPEGALGGLPERLVELRVTDERWLSHLSVGQRLDTAAYELDELPCTSRARAADPTSAPYEVELFSVSKIAEPDILRECLGAGLANGVATYLAANEGEPSLVVDMIVRSADPMRAVAADLHFLTRALAAGVPRTASQDIRLLERVPALFQMDSSFAGYGEIMLVLDVQHAAGRGALSPTAEQEWESSVPPLRLSRPYAEGASIRARCVVPAAFFPLTEPRTWRAHAWAAHMTRVVERELGRGARPRAQMAQVTAVAHLRGGHPTRRQRGADVQSSLPDALLFPESLCFAGPEHGPRSGVYIGTAAGAYRVNPETFECSPLRLPSKAKAVRGFVLEGETLWIAAESAGLLEYRDGAVVAEYKKADGLPSNTVMSVHSRPDGQLLVHTVAGAAVGRPGSWTALPKKSHVLAEESGWTPGEKGAVFTDGDQTLKITGVGSVLSTARQGSALWMLSHTDEGRRVFRADPSSKKAQLMDFIPASIADKSCSVHFVDGCLWLGTDRSAIVRCRGGEAPRWFALGLAEGDHPCRDETRGLTLSDDSKALWVTRVHNIDVLDYAALDDSAPLPCAADIPIAPANAFQD